MPPTADDMPAADNAEAGAAARRSYPAGGPDGETQARLRQVLLGLRSGLMRSNQDLANEALKGSGQDFSLDHMADQASDNTEQMVSIALLEGETEMLEAIEDAIRKIDGFHDLPFGLCETCAGMDAWDEEGPAPWIPTGRLDAVPYARLCVAHQEEQEED